MSQVRRIVLELIVWHWTLCGLDGAIIEEFTTYLHLQLSLRFLVRFSPFEGCERVNQLRMFKCGDTNSAHSLLIHSFTSVKGRKSPSILTVYGGTSPNTATGFTPSNLVSSKHSEVIHRIWFQTVYSEIF